MGARLPSNDLPGRPVRERILGVPVSVVNMKSAVARVLEHEGVGAVFVREVSSLMVARKDAVLSALHEKALLVVPDGMPLVWVMRMRGHADVGRVAGADLVDAVCAAGIGAERSHFFYGGKPGVAERMAETLARRHPGLRIAGCLTPPMRAIGPDFALDDETRAELDEVRASGADFVWVGLSSPKQEYLMMAAVDHLDHGVLIGVGAAFDFCAGTVPRAPRWMQRLGLEWSHRLLQEPTRLWRRYLMLAPGFVVRLIWESLIRADTAAPDGRSG